jgi:hypothetical protein
MSARNETFALMHRFGTRDISLSFEDANALRRAQIKMRAHKIPDREKGALQRIAEICKRNGLHFYHQGDPRGCALYIAKEPLSDVYYHNGVACC